MSAERTLAWWEHEEFILPAGDIGGWYARCGTCPGWQGRPEMTEVEARRRHTEHAHGWPIVEWETHAPPAAAPAPKPRIANFDRLMARLFGPLLLTASGAFVLWALWVTG
jgi:hypothetical protein